MMLTHDQKDNANSKTKKEHAKIFWNIIYLLYFKCNERFFKKKRAGIIFMFGHIESGVLSRAHHKTWETASLALVITEQQGMDRDADQRGRADPIH